MKKKGYIIIASIISIIVLFTMWATNTYINERVFNEDKAALFDECMFASYKLISETQSDFLVLIEAIKESSKLAYSEDKNNYKERFKEIYNERLDNDKIIGRALVFLLNHEIFFSSAVFDYLSDGGGDLRKKKSLAIRRLYYVSLNVKSPEDMEYEELMTTLDELKSYIIGSQEELSVYSRYANENFYAFREINPISKLYIWEKHNKHKNWPFNFFNKQRTHLFDDYADK